MKTGHQPESATPESATPGLAGRASERLPEATASKRTPLAASALSPFYARELGALRNRVSRSLEAFKNGGMILVGDDGRRENEADLVFHASFATAQNVNFAITHARGLLCVSVGHDLADRLSLPTAPKLPGNVAHTGFTLSVDARENITSGISASDRAHTICLLGAPSSAPSDFISPGHVFPVRANSGGLLARSGHTEALLELCNLTNLPEAAAMCEILAEDGEALRPAHFLNATANGEAQLEKLRALPYLSTVDLLWHRVFYSMKPSSQWVETQEFEVAENAREPVSAWIFQQDLEEHITLQASLLLYSEFSPETLRVSITNGVATWHNGVLEQDASAHLALYSRHNFTQQLQGSVNEFCDLSGKEGIRGTKIAVKRVVTQLRALEFLQRHVQVAGTLTQMVESVNLPFEQDKDFLLAVLTL